MKRILLIVLLAFSINAFSQVEPIATYDGGYLYFIPAKLTSQGNAFMYSYKRDYESGKAWFCIFDDKLNVIKKAEVEAEIFNCQERTVTKQRHYLQIGTRNDDGYFLDEWSTIDDVTENTSFMNTSIEGPEIYEDNNNYHSRNLFLSQTLFNDDDEFEFLRNHCEIMPLTYCATDESISYPYTIGGEGCDYYSIEYVHEKEGNVYTLTKKIRYGGVKITGMDVVSLDGIVKKTIDGITDFRTVVSINGNYYVSAYDKNTSKYGLYKLASSTTNLSKISNISGEMKEPATYNLTGLRVKSDTKGIVIRNSQKIFNK